MADPIIPDHYRALVIFHGPSGLPTDRFINGWVFRNDEVTATPHVAIKNMLGAFYNQVAANALKLTSNCLSPAITHAELRTYHLGDPPPREPEITENLGWTFTASQEYTREVALVASYRSDVAGPRGKGRIYLGPLAGTAVGSSSDGPRPNPALITCIVDRMQDLAGSSENATWVQLSQVAGVTNVVTGGWVDNALDTVRSRGNAPTSREAWGSAI